GCAGGGGGPNPWPPARRRGWLAAPPELAEEVERPKLLPDSPPPAPAHPPLPESPTRAHYDRHVRRARSIYRRRRDRLLAALVKHLPELTIEGVAAGVHLLLRLPPAVSDSAIADEASRLGIAVPPLSAFPLTPAKTRRAPLPAALRLPAPSREDRRARHRLRTPPRISPRAGDASVGQGDPATPVTKPSGRWAPQTPFIWICS